MLEVLLLGLGLYWLYNAATTGAALLRMQIEPVGFRFYKITWTDTIIDLSLRFQNISTKDITVQGIQFAIWINNTYIGSSSQPLNLRVNNYGMFTVPLRIRLSTSKLLKLLSQYISTSANEYGLKIDLKGRVGASGVSFPVNTSFSVSIPSIKSLIEKIQALINNQKNDDLVTQVPSDFWENIKIPGSNNNSNNNNNTGSDGTVWV